MNPVVTRATQITFGGIQKSSLIDFPGKVSCVLFVTGCNFRCPYCHNPELLCTNGPTHVLDIEFIRTFLGQRKDLLDGVVISGGEPTLQPGLFIFCQELKELGFAVKLDTNGSRPEVIQDLLEAGLVDYVAMDVKSDPIDYSLFCSQKSVSEAILKSIAIIMAHCQEYEFRTTCVRPIISENIIKSIVSCINGARLYALQRFQSAKLLNPEFFASGDVIFSDLELENLKSIASPWVRKCIIR